MASSVIFIHVSLCVTETGEEVPRNAHKPFLPLRWILVSHRSSLENALYQVSFPLDFFFCLRSMQKIIQLVLNHMSGSRNQPQKISVLTFTALR